eukprot:scaffold24869_cov78-Skeletonema_dohrnii-CCMP3373.AAC.4
MNLQNKKVRTVTTIKTELENHIMYERGGSYSYIASCNCWCMIKSPIIPSLNTRVLHWFAYNGIVDNSSKWREDSINVGTSTFISALAFRIKVPLLSVSFLIYYASRKEDQARRGERPRGQGGIYYG